MVPSVASPNGRIRWYSLGFKGFGAFLGAQTRIPWCLEVTYLKIPRFLGFKSGDVVALFRTNGQRSLRKICGLIFSEFGGLLKL